MIGAERSSVELDAASFWLAIGVPIPRALL